MNRSERIKRIARELETQFIVSVAPDHPYLFRGPDILAARSGELIGFFLPKADELRNWDELVGRFVLSRLALPPSLRCIYVHDPTQPEEIQQANAMIWNFHGVLTLGDPVDIRREL